MKPLIMIFSLLLSTSAFCQSAVDSFFNIKTQKPPENWVELIQNNDWLFYKFIAMKGIKMKYTEQLNLGKMKFDSTRAIYAVVSYPAYYFQKNNSLYFSDADFFEGYKVINITDEYLSMELILRPYFNTQTGEVRRRKEVEKIFRDRRNYRRIVILKKSQP